MSDNEDTDKANRSSRVIELFDAAMALPVADVDQFLADACGGDESLWDDVVAMMATQVNDDQVRASVAMLTNDVTELTTLIGHRVGAYRIDSQIGRGGMGEVYLASRADGQFEKRVAVKVLQQSLNEAQFVGHFQTELRVLATLKHPQIPTLIDAGPLDDGRLYFMADFVDGLRIDHYCTQHNLPSKARIALFEKLCAAVRHAHSNLVLHLDIKPANVLVTEDGIPHLLDFGITRLMNDPETGLRAFTADYASPEQVEGSPPTAASDVYSLGVLLYVLLTEQKPFTQARSAPTDTRLADRERLVSSRIANEGVDIDPDLMAILHKALAYQAEERYQTVEAMLADLGRYRRHFPVKARARTPAYVATKYLRRNAVGLVIATSIIAVLGAFGLREAQLRSKAQAASELAEREAETASQVSRFLTDLFQISNPGEARGNSVTARELLDRGAARIELELTDQPDVRSRLLLTMADVYSSLGLYDAAISLGERAQADAAHHFGPRHARTAETLSALGAMYRLEARYADSAAAHRAALEIRESVLGASDPAVAESLNGLAQAQWYLGDAAAAEASYRRALDIRDAAFGPDSTAVANSLVHLGWLLEREERFDEAYRALKQSLQIRDAQLGGDHFLIAENLDLLAQINIARGEVDEAESQLMRSLDIRRQVLDAKHPDIGMSLLAIARLFRAQGQADKALRYLRTAEQHFIDSLGANHFQVAAVLEDIGLVLADQGQWTKAEVAFRRRLNILDASLTPNHIMIGVTLNNLGWVLSDGLQQYEQGEAVLRRAVASIGSQDQPEGYWDALSRWSLANNLRDQARFVEARDYYSDAQRILEATGGSERAGNPNLDQLLNDVAVMRAAAAERGIAIE